MHEEIAEQQADITRLLLHHVHAPLIDTHYIRGILPVPPPAAAIRVATGANTAHTPEVLTAYEIPLRTNDDLVTAEDVTSILRTLHTGTRIYPSDSVSSVMGMTLVHVDPATVDVDAPTRDDNALTILRSIVHPFTEEEPDPRLRGFLFLEQDRLRLYLDTEEAPGVIAADVRPSGAITALLAALPSLITERGRMNEDRADPHCSVVVDLTDW
ncbi:hypothetical protein ACH492_28030 [Streptomyces sp. NPDC019443]|uniref:hypothetical protein n=1 Tax=Streptomyces sp. NPDC019443 TaxID=3365061 RepID=UPI00379A7F8F